MSENLELVDDYYCLFNFQTAEQVLRTLDNGVPDFMFMLLV